MKLCLHTSDGYCLRKENDYCHASECRCPHEITHTRVKESTTTCEITVEVCTSCDRELTETKTECR